jgi:hypothetical protein
MSFFQPTGSGYLLKIQAVPGAMATKIVGLYGERLKVRVAAPPEKGEANRELLDFLRRKLGLARDQVRLKSGARDRAKVVELLSIDPQLGERLQRLVGAV